MTIERCANFRREITRSGQEVSWCVPKKVDMKCGGFSDLCRSPKDFQGLDPYVEKRRQIVAERKARL